LHLLNLSLQFCLDHCAGDYHVHQTLKLIFPVGVYFGQVNVIVGVLERRLFNRPILRHLILNFYADLVQGLLFPIPLFIPPHHISQYYYRHQHDRHRYQTELFPVKLHTHFLLFMH
jgi:hypothetical protein